MHTHLATSCHPRRFLPRRMPVHHLNRGNKVTFVTLMMVLRALKASPVKQSQVPRRGGPAGLISGSPLASRKFNDINAPAALKLLIRPFFTLEIHTKHFL